MKKHTVVITGAANGIGKSVASAFAGNNCNVVLADIDEENGRKFEKKLNKKTEIARFIFCDVSEPVSIVKLIEKTIEVTGRIDTVINNAGLSEFTSPFELTVEDWDRIISTNLRSCFLMTREAARFMKKSGGGSIVNIASTRASMSEKNSEAYAASKGGIVALTHAMAVSLSEYRIRVNSISPGWIHTGDYSKLRQVDHDQHPAGRVGKPEDVARACLFLCDPENSFITGENLIIDGGMTRKMIYEH